ncbi:MAG: hypothetical protein J6A84_04490 [Clostridia bacterium]|nr:hypothetical protein [Clostridia bacterium]
MIRYKSEKRPLIIAVMAILLSIISITGATLALFTSDAGKGTIGINATSGDLAVDIIDTGNPASSLVGETLDFVTTAQQHEALFEPGATFYTQGFRVKNTGNIPISFIIYISEDDKLEEDFTAAFDVWITKNPTVKGDEVKMQEFTGKLDPTKESDVYYLMVSMKETAGNEYQNRTFSGIGITVCAVQGNVSLG